MSDKIINKIVLLKRNKIIIIIIPIKHILYKSYRPKTHQDQLIRKLYEWRHAIVT